MKNISLKIHILIGFLISITITIISVVVHLMQMHNDLNSLSNMISPDTLNHMNSTYYKKIILLSGIEFVLIWLIFIVIIFLFAKNKKKIEALAYEDNLTGFANSTWFEEAYYQIMQDKESKQEYAIILLDVNNMNSYISKYGLEKGNEIVSKIGLEIDRNKKEDDIFARVHSNQFIVLFEYQNESKIIEFIEKVSGAIKEVTISFGVVWVNNRKCKLDVYNQKAKSSLIEARNSHSGYAIYREVSKKDIVKQIESSMNDALKNNEFIMYLQPKYDLTTKFYCGAEALVRWNKPDGSTIQPNDFISIFEDNGFIMKMDLCILSQACKKISEWIKLGYKPLPISINISQKHMLNNSFINGVLEILSENNIPNELIELDITETCISVTVDKLVDMSKDFYGQEFLISMDRYDDRDSAISILEDVSADTIKLNKAFFENALNNPKVYDAIKNIVYAFKKRDIKVVAEGIETKEQVEMLEKMQCHIAQGYYFSKPLSVEEFDRLIFDKK